MQKLQFNYTFQITKKVIFEVSYYTLGSNKNPYFSTSAAQFNQPKTDFKRCGQCQEDVLFDNAKKFYFKYDSLHLMDLNDEQYQNIINDIELLKDQYNWIDNQKFYNQKDLSKMELKKCTK